MKMPKQQMHYCNHCRKHTLHDVQRVGVSKKKSGLAEGQRRFKRKMRGYGSFPKSNPKGRAKPTRKLDLRYLCTVCKKAHTIGVGFRAKKFELVKVE